MWQEGPGMCQQGDTRPRLHLLCPRATLPSWISQPAEMALPWWEAIPGRPVEQKAHGKEYFPRFFHWLCSRAAQGQTGLRC